MQRTGQAAVTVYPVNNYSFGSKAPKPEKDHNVAERMNRLKRNYERDGMRRSVEGILLVHEHNHPHVLLLQLGQHFFKLPGGRLKPGEDEVEGLRRKLTGTLSPAAASLQMVWDIGECVGQAWRPNFDTMFYPYLPPHITKPKECKKLFILPLPDKCMFAVPRNLKLIAVPFFELYDNVGRYGPIISTLPSLLSRFRLNMISAIPMQLPPAAPPQQQQQQQGQQQGQGQPSGQQQQQQGQQFQLQGPGQQSHYGQLQQATAPQQMLQLTHHDVSMNGVGGQTYA